MLLAFDAGNTQTVIGLFSSREQTPNDAKSADAGLLDHWRVHTNHERTADEYALLIQEFLAFHDFDFEDDVNGIVVGSVVPRVTAALREMARRYFNIEAVVLEPGVRTGMPILYENPKEAGADRIANAVAVIDLYGGPAIVVDFGTATTFDVVSAKGEYLGGAITPGVNVSLDALFDKAAGLRRVELGEPRAVIGRNTAEAIQSGVVFGYAALVDGICDRIEAEVGPCTIISTGGLATVLGPFTRKISADEPWLTLHGLRVVYARNRK
ncbi:MAG: type III pantothenate kinase [Acidimicrobiia bacterium]